jgi:hypothetical protein
MNTVKSTELFRVLSNYNFGQNSNIPVFEVQVLASQNSNNDQFYSKLKSHSESRNNKNNKLFKYNQADYGAFHMSLK